MRQVGPEAQAVRVIVDDAEQPEAAIPLTDDHRDHGVEVLVPSAGR